MSYYADLQVQLGLWKKKRKPIEFDRNLRRKHLCVACAKKNFKVKMDLIDTRYERQVYTRYEVRYFKCPRCGKVEKERMRIEGKGSSGIDNYKDYGGK